MAEEKRRVGRPRTRVEATPGDYVGFRASRELKEKLEAAAAKSGRSLSTEAQFRLERSFERTDLLHEVLEMRYGNPLAGLLMAIGVAMESAGRSAATLTQVDRRQRIGEPWPAEPYAYDQVTKAAARVLDLFRPQGALIPPSFSNAEAIGGDAADEILSMLPPSVDIFPDLSPRDAETEALRRAIGAELISRLPRSIWESDPKEGESA